MLQGRGPRRGLERCAGPSLSSRFNYKQVKYIRFALSTHPSVVYGSRLVSHEVLTHTFVWRPRLKGGEASQAPCPLSSETSPDAQGFFPSGVKTELMEAFCAPPVRGGDAQGPVGEGGVGTPQKAWNPPPACPSPGGTGGGSRRTRPCRSVPLSWLGHFRPSAFFAFTSEISAISGMQRPGLRPGPRLPRGWG